MTKEYIVTTTGDRFESVAPVYHNGKWETTAGYGYRTVTDFYSGTVAYTGETAQNWEDIATLTYTESLESKNMQVYIALPNGYKVTHISTLDTIGVDNWLYFATEIDEGAIVLSEDWPVAFRYNTDTHVLQFAGYEDTTTCECNFKVVEETYPISEDLIPDKSTRWGEIEGYIEDQSDLDTQFVHLNHEYIEDEEEWTDTPFADGTAAIYSNEKWRTTTGYGYDNNVWFEHNYIESQPTTTFPQTSDSDFVWNELKIRATDFSYDGYTAYIELPGYSPSTYAIPVFKVNDSLYYAGNKDETYPDIPQVDDPMVSTEYPFALKIEFDTTMGNWKAYIASSFTDTVETSAYIWVRAGTQTFDERLIPDVYQRTNNLINNWDKASDTNYPSGTLVKDSLATKVDTTTLTAHLTNTSNPHSVTKAQVGLGNVDNTADSSKTFSATQITSGEFDADRIPSLGAGKITSGTFDIGRIPTGTTSSTVCIGDDSRLTDSRDPNVHASTHGKDQSDAISIDASQVTTGVFDAARVPAAAFQKLVVVADEAARKALTSSEVQNGDTVKQNDTGVMYFLKDITKITTDDGWVVYTAVTNWDSITGKPSAFHTTLAVKLTSDGWSSKSQTATASGVTSASTVLVSPEGGSYLSYCNSQVRCTAQGTDTLTFECEDVPTAELTVNVVILL